MSKKEVLAAPRPWSSSTSGPSPSRVTVVIRLPATGTSRICSSGGRPLGSRNRPSKPSARSRSPRARRRRWEKASTPLSSPCAQLEPGGGVGPDHDVGRPARDALAHPRDVRRRPHLEGMADVAQPHLVGRVESIGGAQIPLRQRAKRLLDLAQPGGRGQCGRHEARDLTHGGRSITIDQWPSSRSAAQAPWRSGPVHCAPCATIRLHDTRSGRLSALGAARPGQGRDLRVRAHGLQPHPRRQRAARSSSSRCSSASSSTRATT